MYCRSRVCIKPNQDKNSVLMCPSHGHLSPAATLPMQMLCLLLPKAHFIDKLTGLMPVPCSFLTFLACFLSPDLGHLIALVVISEIQ